MKKLLHKMQPRTLTNCPELLFLHFTEMRLFQPLVYHLFASKPAKICSKSPEITRGKNPANRVLLGFTATCLKLP